MEQDVFNWYRLLPDISLVLSGEINSPHGFSATIVVFLWSLASVFLLFSLIKYIQASLQIRFYLKLLNQSTKNSLPKERREISRKASLKKKYTSLWQEFDETLVTSSDGKQLYNTLDADYIFNTKTLARGLAENRLLAAVPGFLTAIGVIGTFAGLQMGLSSLELNQDAGIEALSSGIGNMISGASIAFLTSVWGVFTSVVFNFIEKLLERSIRSKIYNLQNRIDSLYPRITAEQSLVDIVDLTQASNEVLHGLAEKIGDKMQEAVLQATTNMGKGIEDSLNKIIAPAVQALVDNAQNSSQQVLEELTSKFIDGIGDAGKNQQELMQDAAHNVQTSVSDMGTQMNTFVQNLDQQAKSNALALRKQQIIMSKQMSHAIAKSNHVVQEMSSSLAQQMENQTKNDTIKEDHLQNNIKAINDFQSQFLTRTESMMMRSVKNMNNVNKEQIIAQEQYNEQLNHLLESFNHVVHANKEAGSHLSKTAQQMSHSTVQLNLFSDTVSKASEQISDAIAKSNHVVQEMSSSLAQQMENQTKNDTIKEDHLQNNIKAINDSQSQFLTHTESMMMRSVKNMNNVNKEQIIAQEQYNEQLNRLLESFNHVIHANKEAGSHLSKTAQQMSHSTVQLNSFSDTVSKASEQMSEKISAASDAVKDLTEQNTSTAKQMQQTESHLSKTAQEISHSTVQLHSFSDTISKASEQMSEKISAASDAVKGLTEQNTSTAKQMQQTYSEFVQLRNDLSMVSNTLNKAAEHAETGFQAVDTHLESFQKALLKNVTDLEDQISGLLIEYSEKVNGQTTERLNTWNEQTSTYITSMTDAVRVLQVVVDEIETKVGQ